MSVVPSVLLLVAVMPGLLGSGAQAPAHWKLFQSRSQHFSVRYPPSWNRLGGWGVPPDPDVLGIINFPNTERVEGVVIKKGGAEIWAGGPPKGIDSVDRWIYGYLHGDAILDQRPVPISSAPPNACGTLQRVVTRLKMDDAYEIDTAYYCTVDGKFYGIFLTNWEGDPHQSELQDTALRVALSLRSR